MKKIFSLLIVLVTMFLVIFSFPETQVHAETSEDTTGDGYILPAFGEDEPIYSGDEALSDKDDFEKNNSFKKATDISVHSSEQPDDDTQSINATLHDVNWFFGIWRTVDQDYYRLDVFGDAHITITLNVPSNVNYNIDLWKHSDSTNSGWTTTHVLPMASGVDGGVGGTDRITINSSSTEILTAGTYYIRVYSYNEIYASGSEYTLTYNLDYRPQASQYISQMRFNKGAKAALWKSDFNPYGLTGFELSGEIDVSSAKVPIHNTIEYYSTDYGVVNSVLYIWDTEWRNSMALYLQALIEEIGNEYDEAMEVRVVFDEIKQGTEVVSFALNIVGTISGNAAFSIAGEIVSLAGDLGVEIAKVLFPDEWITTLGDAVNYFIMLRNILECQNNVDSTEVVAIRCKYKYKDKKISFMPTIDSSEVFLYQYDNIDSYNEEAHTYGKVYPITNGEDFFNIAKNGYIGNKNDINTYEPEDIMLDEIKTGNLIKGKYYWYKFIAPRTSTYCFYSGGDIDTYGELFSTVVAARSTENRLSNGYNDDGGEGYNFLINYELNQGQIVYLRVRGWNWETVGTFAVCIEEIEHVHNYSYSYETSTTLKHKAYCSCGEYINEQHNYVNNVCTECGQTYSHTHSYTYQSHGNGRTHSKMCSCGISTTESCIGLAEVGAATRCVKCNQVMSSGSIIMGDNGNDENISPKMIIPYLDEESIIPYLDENEVLVE